MTQTHPRFPSAKIFCDIIITDSAQRLLLIERSVEPYGWALPGGLVDAGEAPYQAAIREAREETGLEVAIHTLLHSYPFIREDGRCTGVSHVFIGRAEGHPQAGSDSRSAAWLSVSAIPTGLLAEHGKIIQDFFSFRKHGVRPGAARSLIDHGYQELVEDSAKQAA